MHVYTCIIRFMHDTAKRSAIQGLSQKRSVRAVVFDYGNVLCLEPTLEDMKGMALVCGLPHERFSELYWKLRPPYDRGDIDGPAYWTAVAGQIALREERHQYILELLGSEGRVLAADLSSRYGVSEDTIRRDLRELASSGKIQRVHGGALPRRAEAVPFVSRQQIDMESKIGIARAAAGMICDGQVVLIDGGTTNLGIASYLSRERSATIVTNSPPLA